MLKKNNNGKRINNFEALKRRVIAAIAAGVILGTSFSVVGLVSKNKKRNDLYNNTTIENIINDVDFKLSKDNESFIDLLESNGYIVDDSIKNNPNNRELDYIYEMYTSVWSLEQVKDNLVLQGPNKEVVYNNIDNFIKGLKFLISTRVPGEINFYYCDLINGKYDNMGESITYNASIDNKDISLIIDTINNRDELYKLNINTLVDRLKKVISASIRVSSTNYVIVYDNDFNYNVTMLDESYKDSYNLLENTLKEYLGKYYGMKCSTKDLSIISKVSENGINWYFYNNLDNTSYLINNNTVNDILYDMGIYRNVLSCYYDLSESDVISRDSYNNKSIKLENKMNKTYKKIKAFK